MTRKSLAHRNGGMLTWVVAQLFPPQGSWSEEDYLGLENLCGGHDCRSPFPQFPSVQN
jgi:hypothetical protein